MGKKPVQNIVCNENIDSNGANENLEQLGKDFNEWCSILTTHSIQFAYAIIAANWAVHGSANAIISNLWSRLSLIVVFIFLAANLLATRLMIRLHFKQFIYAEDDRDRWKKEYEEFVKSKSKRTYWPYTKAIEDLGLALRALKIWAPVMGAIFFMLSLFFGMPGCE